jgi:hypothetical protein
LSNVAPLDKADGEKHGYAIIQVVNQRNAGGFCLGPGTLYGIIKRLPAICVFAFVMRFGMELHDIHPYSWRQMSYRLSDIQP